MVKSVKDQPFSLIQKISQEDSIVWSKETNKYLVLNSKLLALIKKQSSLTLKEFLTLITESFNVSFNEAKEINEDISTLLQETREVELKRDIKHPSIIKSCKVIQYYSFNNIIIKVCFDTKKTKSLIHQKYSHLAVESKNIYNVKYKILFTNLSKKSLL